MIITRAIVKPINKVLEAANKISDGNIDVALDINSKDEIGTMAKAFENMINNLNNIMTNIN